MGFTRANLRRRAATAVLVCALLVMALLVIRPSLLGTSSAGEPPAFPSDDFAAAPLDDRWVATGSVGHVDDAGGSLRLDGREGRAQVTRSVSGEMSFELGYASTHRDGDALAPGSSTGLVLRDGDERELSVVIAADDDGVTTVAVLDGDDALSRLPLGAPTAPRIDVSQRDDFLAVSVAPPGEDPTTVGAIVFPIAVTELVVFAEGTDAALDYAADLRDPFEREDRLFAAPVSPVADAGPDVGITDDDGDGVETLTFRSRSQGEVAELRWWVDGAPQRDDAGQARTEPEITVALPVGTHRVLLEAVSPEGGRDVDAVEVTIASATTIGSDDFSYDEGTPELADWEQQGQVTLSDESGGSVVLDGVSEVASIGREVDAGFAVAVGYTAIPPVAGLRTGVEVVEETGRVLRFGLEVGGDDVVRATVVDVGDGDRVVSSVPIGASASPTIRVAQREGVWSYEIAPTPLREIVASVFTAEAPVTQLRLVADGGVVIIDSFTDEREPLESEDGVVLYEPPAFARANAGADEVLFDRDGDGVETVDLTAQGCGSCEIAGWRWTVEDQPAAYGPTTSVTVGTGTHLVELEVVSATGQRDVDTLEILVVDPQSGPLIRSWYDDDDDESNGIQLSVDRVQHPQRWVNVLGSIVTDSYAGLTATYAVDGIPGDELSIGPNDSRLSGRGDFNVELSLDDLADGPHEVLIRATDAQGIRSELAVELEVTNEPVEPTAPDEIVWADVTALGALTGVEPIDGRWTPKPGDGLEIDPADTGYDRLLGIGSDELVDYEVDVTFTIKSYHPPTDESKDRPAVGLLLRWEGHNESSDPEARPRVGFRADEEDGTSPAGAFAFWRVTDAAAGRGRAVFHGPDYSIRDSDSSVAVPIGVRYRMWASVETVESGATTYRFKLWADGTEEPEQALGFTTEPGETQPATGSIVMLAHHASVLWERTAVTITGQ